MSPDASLARKLGPKDFLTIFSPCSRALRFALHTVCFHRYHKVYICLHGMCCQGASTQDWWGLTIFSCCFQSPFQFVTAYLGSAPLVPLHDIRLLRQAKRDQQVWDNILTYRIQQAPSCLAGQIKVSGNTVQHNAHRLQLIFLSSGVALTVANHCSGLLFSLTKHGFLSKQNQETTASFFL